MEGTCTKEGKQLLLWTILKSLWKKFSVKYNINKDIEIITKNTGILWKCDAI